MQMTAPGVVRLAILEVLESASPTAAWLELELTDTLPVVGIPEHQVDAVLVRAALRELERDGHASKRWATSDVDELGRPRQQLDED